MLASNFYFFTSESVHIGAQATYPLTASSKLPKLKLKAFTDLASIASKKLPYFRVLLKVVGMVGAPPPLFKKKLPYFRVLPRVGMVGAPPPRGDGSIRILIWPSLRSESSTLFSHG